MICLLYVVIFLFGLFRNNLCQSTLQLSVSHLDIPLLYTLLCFYYIVPPSITPSITNRTAIEGTSFTTPLTITDDPFPVSSNIIITNDAVTVQDGRITVNIGSGNGASSFKTQNVNRTDSGSYTVNVTTTAGSDTAVVNLDVYCE